MSVKGVYIVLYFYIFLLFYVSIQLPFVGLIKLILSYTVHCSIHMSVL